MPTETFFNLPAAKREKLAEAINAELARVPFPEMSINRIVQSAGIPRGSYYQYFLDRDDLFSFLISDYQSMMIKVAEDVLHRANGDMFSAALFLFDESAAFVREAGNKRLVTHLFDEVKRRLPFAGCDGARGPKLEAVRPILCLIDRSRLRAENDEALSEMVFILFSILGGAVLDVITSGEPEKVKRQLAWRLDLLKNGMGRERA